MHRKRTAVFALEARADYDHGVAGLCYLLSDKNVGPGGGMFWCWWIHIPGAFLSGEKPILTNKDIKI